MKKILSYFNPFEYSLWLSSVILISLFQIFFSGDMLSLIASLIGITALIFCAKGNPIGQALIIVFSLFYGYISYTFSYYGEMMTYLGMSMPMAVWALISWVKNPYSKGKREVQVNSLKVSEYILAFLLSLAVTFIFCPVLYFFNTENLVLSTVSVTTSFFAVYLTARRSPYYALAYAANDIVLIALWILASVKDTSYIGVVLCFTVFLVNDLYGFFNWRKMEKRQAHNGKREPASSL